MTTEVNALSFNPSDASVGGNLHDKDCTITKSEIVPFDYNGKSEQGMLCCWAVTYRPWDAESDDDVSIDYMKLGTMEQFTPSADGKRAIPVGSKTQLHKDSKPMLYTRALIAAGFQANQIGVDVSVIEGLNVHLATIGIKGSGKDKDGKDIRDGKVTVVTKIHEAGPVKGNPAAAGKKAAAPKTTAPAAAGKPAAAAAPATNGTAVSAVSEDVSAKAAEFIFNEIANAGGNLAKSMLPGKAFKAFQGDERNAVVKAINDPAWIGAAERPWKVSGGNLVVE